MLVFVSTVLTTAPGRSAVLAESITVINVVRNNESDDDLFDREELSVITAAVDGSILEEEEAETNVECKPAVVVVGGGRPVTNVVGVASVLGLVAVVLAPSLVVYCVTRGR